MIYQIGPGTAFNIAHVQLPNEKPHLYGSCQTRFAYSSWKGHIPAAIHVFSRKVSQLPEDCEQRYRR